MKMLPVSPIDSETESKVRDLLAAQTPISEVIETMRSLGLDKIDSMKLLRSYAGVTLGQAKELVHLSDTWADRLESDEAFHDSAIQAAKEAGYIAEPMKVSA